MGKPNLLNGVGNKIMENTPPGKAGKLSKGRLLVPTTKDGKSIEVST